jgi:hypothetical protein
LTHTGTKMLDWIVGSDIGKILQLLQAILAFNNRLAGILPPGHKLAVQFHNIFAERN